MKACDTSDSASSLSYAFPTPWTSVYALQLVSASVITDNMYICIGDGSGDASDSGLLILGQVGVSRPQASS